MTETALPKNSTEQSGPRKYLAWVIAVALLLVGLGGFVGLNGFPDDPDLNCVNLRSKDQRASRAIVAADLQNQLVAVEAQFRDALAQLAIEQTTTGEKIESLTQEAENLSDVGLASNKLEAAQEDLQAKVELVASARADLENAQNIQNTDNAVTDEAAAEVQKRSEQALAAAVNAEAVARTAVAEASKSVAELSAKADDGSQGEEGEAKVAASKSLEEEIEDLGRALETMEAAVRDQFMQVDVKRQRLETLLGEMGEGAKIAKLARGRTTLIEKQLEILPTDTLSKINQELADLRTQTVLDESAIEAKDQERTNAVADLAKDWPEALVFTSRSSVALQPATPVVSIKFGPHRSPQRIEVPFESSASAAAEQGLASQGDPDIVDDLPGQATFLAEPGTLSGSDGAEISPDQIEVWARRLGPTLLLSICVSPPDGLPAGTYTGDVYLVDPSLNPVRVPVEVTAQFQWINSLYGLLLIVPLAAILYVWYTGRIAANLKPAPKEALFDWLTLNLVPLLGVGFASVWATLQVAFTNPTWGSTVYGAAAVVGACLVASVTAITAVAGSVVGSNIRDQDQVDEERKAKRERDKQQLDSLEQQT